MKKLIPVCLCWLLLHSGNAFALTDDQVTAVRDMGKLNGVALQCGYFDQTRVMKKQLVEVLPKIRALGLAFDEASNESFLAFIENGETCPTADALMESVKQSLQDLRQQFSGQ